MAADTTYTLAGSRAVLGAYNPAPSAIPTPDLVQQQTQVAVGSAPASTEFGNVAAIAVTQAGVYECWGTLDVAAGTGVSDVQAVISTFTGNTTTDHVRGVNLFSVPLVAAAGVGSMRIGPYYITEVAGALGSIYLKAAATDSGALTDIFTGTLTIKAVRDYP